MIWGKGNRIKKKSISVLDSELGRANSSFFHLQIARCKSVPAWGLTGYRGGWQSLHSSSWAPLSGSPELTFDMRSVSYISQLQMDESALIDGTAPSTWTTFSKNSGEIKPRSWVLHALKSKVLLQAYVLMSTWIQCIQWWNFFIKAALCRLFKWGRVRSSVLLAEQIFQIMYLDSHKFKSWFIISLCIPTARLCCTHSNEA